MSSEKFDDRIRQKLNQLEPAHDAAAWSRIESRLPATPGMWASVSWKKAGIALYMAGTTAALVLLWWNQEKLDRRNQELDQKVQQLLASRLQASATHSGLEMVGKPTQTESIAQATKPASENTSGTGDVKAGAELEASAQAVEQTNKSGSWSTGRLFPKKGYRDAIPTRNRMRIRSNAANGPVFTRSETPTSEGFDNQARTHAPSGNNLLPATQAPKLEITTGSASQKNTPQTAQAQPLVEPIAVEQVPTKQALGADSVRKEPALALKKDTVPAAIRKLGAERRPSIFANLNPRIGLDFSSDFGSMLGPGLHGEFSLSPRFTTSIGFIAYFPVKEQFRDAKDYNARTGLNFLDLYGDHLPANFHEVEAIQIKTRVLEIPVRFRYFTPLNAHWQWLLGMGTHFNISAKQDLNCEVHMEQGDDAYLSYAHAPTPEFFHNLEFSTGLEYRNGGMALRITPYYQYNFTTLQYLDKVHLLGLNLGLYFRP